MGTVSALVPRHERWLVRVRLLRLRRRVVRRPGISRRLRRRTCVQVAAIAPQLPPDRLSLLVWAALWPYQFDDRVEAIDADPAAVNRLRDSVAAVVAGDGATGSGPEGPLVDDPLLADLGQLVQELSRHDATGAVVARYGGAVRAAAMAEVDQLALDRAVASGASSAPTLEDYLELAVQNVNYRGFAYALLALGDDPLTGPQLRCLDIALRHACYAVRLANDVRGVAQDRARATLNVLDLRTATGTAVTPQYALDEAVRHVRAHDGILRSLASLGVLPPGPVHALTRGLAQAVRLYRWRPDLR